MILILNVIVLLLIKEKKGLLGWRIVKFLYMLLFIICFMIVWYNLKGKRINSYNKKISFLEGI